MSEERNHLLPFEQAILPHLDAAYNLAHWIVGNDQDAEDMVQEAYLRAYQYYDGFKGNNSRSWLLMIVRNTCYTWLRQNHDQRLAVELSDELADNDTAAVNPELFLLLRSHTRVLRAALDQLPVEFREIIFLRDIEEFSYKEIAGMIGVPMGTVMSRLARARQQLKRCLLSLIDGGRHDS